MRGSVFLHVQASSVLHNCVIGSMYLPVRESSLPPVFHRPFHATASCLGPLSGGHHSRYVPEYSLAMHTTILIYARLRVLDAV